MEKNDSPLPNASVQTNEVITEKRLHAELGGSTADRWTNCPGSIFLLRTVPRSKPGQSALWGTSVHDLSQRLLTAFIQNKITGQLVVGPTILDLEDPDAVELAEGYVRAIWSKALEETITGKAFGTEDSFILDTPLDMFGTIDFWAIYIDDKGLRTAVIVDLKTGYHKVEASKNAQLAFYACALRQWIQNNGKDLDRIRCAIYQPRAGGEIYSEVSYNATQLDRWKNKFFTAAKQIFITKKPKFKTGPWCKFCDAQAICPKYGKELAEKSELALINPAEIKLPLPQTMSDASLSKLLTLEDDIVDFLKKCRQHVIDRHSRGDKLPGWKLVSSVRRRKWKENEPEIAAELTKLGVADPFNKKLKAITVIEKLIGKKALESLTELTLPSPTLVADTDERQELQSMPDLLGALPDDKL